jgi:hypothetical protein
VRAELITDTQLEAALSTQGRTLKRLGDVLVSSGYLSAERFKHMMQLQATETLYRLFTWKAGTYEFKQEKVELDGDNITPIRAESVLMEGFRMVDEWPVIRKTIRRQDMSFERLRVLPPPPEDAASKPPPSDDPFEAMDQIAAEVKSKDFKNIGENERRVFDEITSGRDLRKLVDISGLGEFETCKALLNLVNAGFVRPIYPEGREAETGDEPLTARLGAMVGRVVATMAVLAGVGFVFLTLQPGEKAASSFSDPATQRFISRAQQTRIEAALEVFQLERGALPETLEGLVSAGLLRPEELRYPWREQYHYRRVSDRQFILLPPLR